jgi:hypothetical protein
MYDDNNGGRPNRCSGPVNVACDPSGQLFMTSDTTNEIWVIGGAMKRNERIGEDAAISERHMRESAKPDCCWKGVYVQAFDLRLHCKEDITAICYYIVDATRSARMV